MRRYDGPISSGTPDERGNALVVALLVLLVLTSAGVTYVAVTKSEKQIAGNQMSGTQALYAAEAGLTEGLHRMAFRTDTTSYIGPSGPAQPGWGRYIVLSSGASALDPDGPGLEADGFDNDGDASTDEAGERYPELATKQTVGMGPLTYPYVRVEFKTRSGQLVRFGDADGNPLTPPKENYTLGAPVLRLTASGRRGTAAKTLEAEAVRFPLVEVGAPLWCGGKMNFIGNAFILDGHDHYPTSPYDTIPGAPPLPAILTEGPTGDAQLAAYQQDNAMGAGGIPSVAHSAFTYDFIALWNTLTSMGDYSFTGDQSWSSSTPSYGSLTSPRVTAVNGNLDIQGSWTGGGILMVNGNLKMGGGSTFTGIVIVRGDLSLAGGGPADVARVVGALIYEGTLIDASKFGGSGRVYYSSQAINSSLTLARYSLAWWRER